jgi:hypothetical protein
MADDRIGQPIKIADMFLKIGRNIADTQLERGDITKEEYDEIIKILYPTPKIAKKDGGIVHMEKGGDALLGKLVENLKNKPKLGSTTETMTDVIDALNVPSDTVTNRPSSRIVNILKGSKVERAMGPDLFEIFKKKGIESAQIRNIVNVPNIMDYEDDFDGFNKAMKKYRTTALKGLNDSQIATIKNSGMLSGYIGQFREEILEKGVTRKGNKFTVNPKYKNAIEIVKTKPYKIDGKTFTTKPKISKAFQNKYLDKNFDFVFKTKGTATGVNKPKIQSQIYTKIQELADKVKMNAKQKLNLDFTLAQIDKLFQAGQTKKAKAALSALVALVSKGAFGKVVGAATGPFGTAAMGVPEVVDLAMKGKENIIDPKIIEPAAAKMVEGENMLENFLKGKIPSFEKGGPVDMPGKKEEVSSDFIAQAEIALKNAMREKGSSLTESEKLSLAFQLADPSKKVSDPSKSEEENIKIFEDKVNKMVDVLTMVEGSAVVDLNKKDKISDDVIDFMKRGINKLGRTFN